MNITTNFDAGDKVWVVYQNPLTYLYGPCVISCSRVTVVQESKVKQTITIAHEMTDLYGTKRTCSENILFPSLDTAIAEVRRLERERLSKEEQARLLKEAEAKSEGK
jgi:hypothetical protein